MPFTGQVTGQGRVFTDGGATWTVPDGMTPEQARGMNAQSQGWGTSLAPTAPVNTLQDYASGNAYQPQGFTDPAMNADIYGLLGLGSGFSGNGISAGQQLPPTTTRMLDSGNAPLTRWNASAGGAGQNGATTTSSTSGIMPAQTWQASATPDPPFLGGDNFGDDPMAQTGKRTDITTRMLDSGNAPPPPGFTAQAQGTPYGRVGSVDPAADSDPYGDLFGLGPLPSVRDIQLGTMPTMDNNYDPRFLSDYARTTSDTASSINDIYGKIQLPNAQASQIDLSQLPQLSAQQVGQSPSLLQLLSGQGFDPATMARLNAGATDTISRQAASNRGSARLGLESAGLAGSPAETVVLGQINRQRGDATTQALNQNAIENAGRGLENFRAGAQMDMGRETNNMQQANALALSKASQMLSAMQQNAQNSQQANMANFGAQSGLAMERGQRQADVYGNAGQALGSAQINRKNSADQQNSSNQFNWDLNQAQLDRGADTANAGIQQGLMNTGINGLLGLAGMQNPATYSGQGSSLLTQQNPTNLLGSTLTNVGGNLLDRATA